MVLAVQTRLICSIIARVLIGVDDDAYSLTAKELVPYEPEGGGALTQEEVAAREAAALKIQEKCRQRASSKK